MATATKGATNDARRYIPNPEPNSASRVKTRDNTKDTLCRNVTIYGHCRFENKGCAFSHDTSKNQSNGDNMKKRFNVDSPSFTPSSQNGANGSALLSVNGTMKPTGLSPKSASAAPFKPKGLGNNMGIGQENAAFGYGKKSYNPNAPDWSMVPSAGDMNDFLPQQHNLQQNMGDVNDLQQGIYDSYNPNTSPLAAQVQPQISQPNPYTQDQTTNGNQNYYQPSQYTQPLQHHLYAHWGTILEDLQPYQRAARDFFIPDNIRKDLQDKAAAALQTLPNSKLPVVEGYNNLVALDMGNSGNNTILGTPTWIYKANWGGVSHQRGDGKTYALRRLAAFKLHETRSVLNIKDRWRAVENANVVKLLNIFTTREFGDSSVVIATEYWPLSKTLAETHFSSRDVRYAGRQQANHVQEQVLWSYMVQITNALRAIHNAGLAARVIDATKILVTSKNHIRLNACGILDIIELYHKPSKSLQEHKRMDFVLFGRLILALGTNTINPTANIARAQEQFARIYSHHLTDRVNWLLNQATTPTNESIEHFAMSIASQAFNAFDAQSKVNDANQVVLSQELENSRIARLMMKLNFILERPEYAYDRRWEETGDRFPIKLFRDYVFHQVTPQGVPVLNLAHVITCLNRLDAGTDDMITLTTRDDEHHVHITYKEIKHAINSAFMDLNKGHASR